METDTMHEVFIAPSVMSADLIDLAGALRTLDQAGVQHYHLDIMDGQFVPNITFGPCVVRSIRAHTTAHLDAHLMIVEPERFIEPFIKAGADTVTLHVEENIAIRQSLEHIIELGAVAGVTLNPDTSLEALEPVIDIAGLVLIMSVFPGFSGQSFIPESVARVRAAKAMIRRRNPSCKLAVDGGVNNGNARELAMAGADILVAASSVFNAGVSPPEAARNLRLRAREG